MRRFALAALIMMASSTSVHAQVYERPKHTVGDTWSYTNGQVTKVVKVSEDSEVQVRLRPCPTCQWVLDKDDNLTQVLTEDKTKAGTFKAYRIDRSWKTKVHGKTTPDWNDAIWIAPDVKGLVKFDPGLRGPWPGGRGSWAGTPWAGTPLPTPSYELESYKIAP